jgi:hypothetical protein
MEFHIKERSVIAGLAAIVLKGKRVAITIGKTIYLTGVYKQEFLSKVIIKINLKLRQEKQRKKIECN